MKWMIDDSIIKQEKDNNISYPKAKEILDTRPHDLKLNYSTFLALNYEIIISCEKGEIFIQANAIKGNKNLPIKIINGYFSDYVISEETFYYISPSINEVNKILEKLSIDLSSPINFFTYINFKKELNLLHANYIDDVINKTNLLKEDTTKNEHEGFIGTLYPYQESGVRWLTFMTEGKCGCILADSMGLGKTLQIILTVGHLKEKNKKENQGTHCLIIAPLSILENWRREFNKFYPSLKCFINHGKTNLTFYKELLEYDVIITSYSSIKTNFATYHMIEWDLIILDEAQNIKNPNAQRTKTIKKLNKKVGIAVSGTPFENHVTDIWSIMDFVLPQYLGSIGEFNNKYEDDEYSASILEQLITPFMIRRKVENVAKDLPNKIDIPQPLEMTYDEAKFYDEQIKSFGELKTLRLDKIQVLRMFCSHPSVYNQNYINYDPIKISQKYERCCEILEEIIANNEKVIIFTSFNEMIDLLVKDIHNRFNIPTDFINGNIEAKDRQAKIDAFSQIKGAAVLVLNPKAAGAGLNITAANHVIHYNLEWNPAIEDQASARAYRRGQKKTVFIYRLYYMNTIEELINEKIEKKRNIANTAIIGNEGQINNEDLVKILSMSPLKNRKEYEI